MIDSRATRRGGVLVVCTGNVCRSPFIERMLQRSLAATGIRVSSAGTEALVGEPMDPRAATQLERYRGDSAGFVARQLTPALVADADLVLAATRGHRGEVAAMNPRALPYTFTLRDFADLVDGLSSAGLSAGDTADSWVRQVSVAAARRRAMVPPRDAESVAIVDPYRRGDATFAVMAQQVTEILPAVARALSG